MNQISKMQIRGRLPARRHILLTAAAVCLIGSAALAQDNGTTDNQGYKVGEKQQSNQADPPPTPGNQPPAEIKRLVRFDYVSGNVTWRLDDGADWKKAKSDQTLREGGQISVKDGGHAEIRFDDGSLLRLGNGAVVTLKTVYGDTQGNFTEIKMAGGVITLRPKYEKTVFQVDTPYNTVKTNGPSRVRVDVGSKVDVGVRMGKATVEGKPGKTVVSAGSSLSAQTADSSYEIASLPREDSWERWNDDRDHLSTPSYARPGYYAPGPPFFFGLSYGGGYYGHYGGHGGWRR